jgi:uncharacterized protein (TIGR02147 family)
MKHLLVFNFKTYKDYLRTLVGPKNRRSGIKSSIARALKCQATYVSQVLYSQADLSLEQAEALSGYLGHTSDEQKFFLTLVQKDRAGSKTLKSFFDEQLNEMLERRLVLSHRLGAQKQLSDEQKAIYYSSWQFAAIHVALTIAELRSRDALARFFALPAKRVTEVLEFLLRVNLVKQDKGLYSCVLTGVRLGRDSPHILKHHTHWRLRAVESLERESLTDLHYSAVVSLSASDVVAIKERLLDSINDNINLVKNSKSEKLFGMCVDFFELGHR